VGKLEKFQYDKIMGREIFEEYETKRNKWYEDFPLVPQMCVNGTIAQGNYKKYQTISNEEKVTGAVSYTYIHSFQTSGGHNVKGAVNDTSLKRFCKLSIDEYTLFHEKLKRVKYFYNCDALGENEFILEYLTDKAPTRYEKIETVSKDIRKGVKQFEDCDSDEKELLRLLGGKKDKLPRPFRTLIYSDSPYLETKGYRAGGIDETQMKRLIGKLVDSSIKESHFIFSCRAGKSIQGGKYTNIAEVIGRIEKLPRENGEIQLDCGKIYTDTGYLNDDGNWKNVKAQSSMKSALDLLVGNQSIYENVFQEFERQKKEGLKQCYVLVCINEKSLDESVKERNEQEDKVKCLLTKCYMFEVFITDFDFIVPNRYKYTSAQKYNSNNKGKADYTFAKYEISEFCKLLNKYMFKSSKAGSLGVVKDGDGYRFSEK
jgi:hypothetical protein